MLKSNPEFAVESAASENSIIDLIDYEENSVVSKKLLKQPVGNITLMAFDRKQKLMRHKASSNTFVQILEGIAEIVVAGRSKIMKKGDVFIMPAEKLHDFKALERFKMLLILIRE